jgi:hypothetical protein
LVNLMRNSIPLLPSFSHSEAKLSRAIAKKKAGKIAGLSRNSSNEIDQYPGASGATGAPQLKR